MTPRTAASRPHQYAAVALLLAVAMFAVSCGGSDPTETTEAPTAQVDAEPTPDRAEPEPSAVVEPTTAPTAEATAAPVPTATAPPEPTPAPAPSSLFNERGPFAVGVTTRSLQDRDVEIWYPVDPATVEGNATEIFDALSAFPEDLQTIVPPELSGEYDTLAVRDAQPLASTVPVVIYGHGFGGYRQIATHFTSHLASWGFVVASTDHLERGIAEQTLDLVGAGLFDETNIRPDAAVADVRDTVELLRSMNDEGPLAGAMDLEQLAISGHSAGAFAAVQAADGERGLIDGWISISGGTRDDIELAQPGLVIIGELDAVVPAERSYELFESGESRRTLLNVQGAGHNSFTDPCRGITDLGGLGALTALLGEEQVARAEDGCTPDATAPETVQAMVNHVSVAWLNDLFGIAMDGDPLAPDVVAALGPVADYQTD